MIVITWDEDERAEGNRIPTLAIAPSAPAGRRPADSSRPQSLLRTTEELLGITTFLSRAGDPGTRSMRADFDICQPSWRSPRWPTDTPLTSSSAHLGVSSASAMPRAIEFYARCSTRSRSCASGRVAASRIASCDRRRPDLPCRRIPGEGIVAPQPGVDAGDRRPRRRDVQAFVDRALALGATLVRPLELRRPGCRPARSAIRSGTSGC